MKRSKSNLASPKPPEEPLTGPGSAVCFCRVQDRRIKAQEAHEALRGRAAGQNGGQDGPKFADFSIVDIGALDEFYEAVREKVEAGQGYRVRVAAL